MVQPKILIVDDDEDLVKAMDLILEKYRVISASNGAKGLKRAKIEKPDLIILDVMMETGNEGFDIARKLRLDLELAKIPILMLTAIREKTGFDFSQEAGDETWLPVDDYAEKPLRPAELLGKVKKLLKQ